ncbi:MAG: Uma2 family endonuclease [Spirulina sp. SIO3F2]|nr:Uma2 family endonuclease [Spirulina sp. SIO3F2]
MTVQAPQKALSFDEFLAWYPEDGKQYELLDGEIREVRPIGEHEEIGGLITRCLDREIERLNLPYIIPKTCCVKPLAPTEGYVPDVIVLDRRALRLEPLWREASTITQGKSAKLVVEVVSTNWHNDYARKLEEYELLEMPEYWIVDYRALGGRRYIGTPKNPVVTVYCLENNEYVMEQFRGQDVIQSRVFSELKITAESILTLPEF